MTKVKLKDAIKDLTTDAAKVRDDASRVRQSADGLAKSLRALENGFIKSLNAKAEQEKRAEEEKRLSDHSKAYVMLDVDEQAAVNAARQEAKTEAPKSEQKPAPKAEAKPEVKAEAPKSEQKPETKAETKPEAPKKPAIGQIISRPGQALPPKPVGLAPNVIRPPRPQQPRPQGQQGVQGNRPQQGQPRPGGNGAFIARPQQGGRNQIIRFVNNTTLPSTLILRKWTQKYH